VAPTRCCRATVDKSLVTTNDQSSETRYGMLETVRQYATARLADASEVDGLRDRHLAYHLRWPRPLNHRCSVPDATTPFRARSLPNCRT
jgi:predicted ATPase